jgi:hypothetical protein
MKSKKGKLTVSYMRPFIRADLYKPCKELQGCGSNSIYGDRSRESRRLTQRGKTEAGGNANQRVGIEFRPALLRQRDRNRTLGGQLVLGVNPHTGMADYPRRQSIKGYLLAGLARNKTMEQINPVTIEAI